MKIHRDSAGVYGSPRIHQALQQQGHCVGRNRIEKVMREAGVVGKVATLYRRVPGMERFYLKHQNLRLQAPPPSDVDQQWAADLTYIKVADRWQYLAVVMDVYSRRIIGWSLGAQKTAELTLRALRQALRHRRPRKDLIFHTDRGVEYGAYLIQNELQRHGIRASMNRPGACTDNAHMESFFHSLKTESIHGEKFRNEHELRMAIAKYINRFYNPLRLHSSIGYLSPMEFERVAA